MYLQSLLNKLCETEYLMVVAKAIFGANEGGNLSFRPLFLALFLTQVSAFDHPYLLMSWPKKVLFKYSLFAVEFKKLFRP